MLWQALPSPQDLYLTDAHRVFIRCYHETILKTSDF
jgi:hypothetical protein